MSLYTLPFHYDRLDHLKNFDCIQSNNVEILNCPWTWYHVRSIGLSNLDINLIKQLKRKMPNLISIEYISSYDLISENDMTLDSVNTLQCRCELLEEIKPWFIFNLPNVKSLILSCNPGFALDFESEMYSSKLDKDFYNKWINTNYGHYSKIENVEVKVFSKARDDLSINGINIIQKVLEIFKYSKTFIFHFYAIRYQSSSIPIVDLRQIYLHTKINEILNRYQIKKSYNYLQLIKNI